MNLHEDALRDASAALISRQSDGRSLSYDDGFDDAGAAAAPVGPDGSKPPIKRRAPIACKRCRRMRSKCIHDKATPPCKSCGEAGLTADDCIFPVRGQPDKDRDYRHPRVRRTDKAVKREPGRARQDSLDMPVATRLPPTVPRPKHADEWDLLPPLPDIIEAVHLFTRNYFQLGFIPKDLFREQLATNHRSVSVFLLLGILSISARFSSSLAARYDGEIKAAAFFMDRANAIALQELYQEPTLERCQGFYLLSLAQQGSGMRNRSYMNLGIATRMAVLMHLHREEFYKSTSNIEDNIRLESARRTLWMLHSQDNLHSGAMSPISLAASDITCLLPSDETDFALGRVPVARAALEDTPPARENPGLIHQSARSLFASLIQAHYYWGRVARRAIVSDKSSQPWDPKSDYAVMAEKLANWENRLPQDHRWSMVLLNGHKSVGEDLAYMNVTMMTKLCNVVLRRPYLDQMITPNPPGDQHRRAFFSRMSDELFKNVRDLYEQIDAQYATRGSEDSVGAQMASFCVYSCGLFSTYLCKYKNICSDRSIIQQGPNMLQRCMTILIECKEIWPLASRWLESLERYSRDPKAAAVSLDRGMADGDDRTLKPLHMPYSPSFAGKVGKQGRLPPPLKLPGPSSPNEDSKANVLLALNNASPSVTQAATGPQQPTQQANHDHHASGPQGRPPPSNQPPPHTLLEKQHHPSYPNTVHHQALSHQRQQHPQQQHPQQQSQVPAQHMMYPQQRLHQQPQQMYAQQHQHHHQHQHPHQHPQQHQYAPQNPMNMLAQAAFDQPAYQTGPMQQMVSPQTAHSSQMYQLPQLQQPPQPAAYEGPAQPGFFTPPTPTVALGPGNDGFEVELQSWFDDTSQSNGWVGNGVGIGYSI